MRIRRSAIGLFLFAILLSDLQIQRAAAATPTTSGLYACSFSTQNRNNALTDGPATGGSPCATITSIGSNIDADSAYALSPNITDKNGISYAWTGYFKAPTTGNYIFATRTRWWSYLWIDDLAVSGAKYNHATTFNSSTNNATLRNQLVKVSYLKYMVNQVILGIPRSQCTLKQELTMFTQVSKLLY